MEGQGNPASSIQGVKITDAQLKIDGDIVGRDKVLNIYTLTSSAGNLGDNDVQQLLTVARELLVRKISSVCGLEDYRRDEKKLLERLTKFGNVAVTGLDKPNPGSDFMVWAEYEKSVVALICDALNKR